MSGEALYERYKDALKRGHVASLRGRLQEALDAYGEASALAPERPTPHNSAGAALLRGGRPDEALHCYDVALDLAPRDDTALAGRAQSLAALGRRAGAADAFDNLAEARAAGARLADAVDASRRALELAEGRERRRTLERLIARLRVSEPGEPGRLAMERALLVLEGTALSGPGAVTASADGAPTEIAPPVPESAEPEPEQVVSPVRAALDRGIPADADPTELAAAADAAIDAGDLESALERLLDLAAANHAAGRRAAAIDACYGALSIDPDHVDLHLALVELYDDHGWSALATEKLDLLDRLVALGDDDAATARVAAARAGRD